MRDATTERALAAMKKGIEERIFPGHEETDPIHGLAQSCGKDYAEFAYQGLIAAGFRIVPSDHQEGTDRD